jgi:Tfp pilus assembly protein PilX
MTRLNRRSETGATLVVSLIMLTLITLMIIAALAIGSANFKTVTNMQFRDGAVDAANKAIEQVVSSAFALAPSAETINVDLDNNLTTDYVVEIALPVCVRATKAEVTAPSSESLPPAMGSVSSWNTVWDIRATVTGNNPGQAAVDVRAGVRVLLTEAQKDAVCI